MSIVLEGLVKPDGTLELAHHPALRPGRVRVTLDPMFGPVSEVNNFSDESCAAPMLDSWVALPLPENRTRLRAKLGEIPLPDPQEIPVDDGGS